jgi:hypothetical protein
VRQQCAKGARAWRRRPASTAEFRCSHQAGKQAHRGTFHVPFAAGDLPCKTDVLPPLQAQLPIEHQRRIEEGIAVQSAKPREFRVL